MTVAGMIWQPDDTLMYQAMMPPKVTISPWAKLVRPVVPKMSERPIDVMPMMRPKRMPVNPSWRNRSKVVVDARWRAPTSLKKALLVSPGRRTSTVTSFFPSAMPTSSGRVSGSSVTV